MNNSAPHPPHERPGLCRVQLETFQGPLDVLLHLVRTNEIDITSVAGRHAPRRRGVAGA